MSIPTGYPHHQGLLHMGFVAAVRPHLPLVLEVVERGRDVHPLELLDRVLKGTQPEVIRAI